LKSENGSWNGKAVLEWKGAFLKGEMRIKERRNRTETEKQYLERQSDAWNGKREFETGNAIPGTNNRLLKGKTDS